MDVLVISIFLSEISVYFFIQSIFLRTVSRNKNLLWQIRIIKLFMLLLGAFSIFLFLFFKFDAKIFFTGIVSSALFILAVVIYLLSVYSYVESSITVKIFWIISNQSKGIRKSDLKKVYGREKIVQRRLNRFIAIGEVVYTQKKYALVHKVSAFSLRNVFGRVFTYFFP